jgi:formyltetrahydrofolate deformylase
MQKLRCLLRRPKGIIATVTNFILKVEGNITYLDQHVDIERNVFLCD